VRGDRRKARRARGSRRSGCGWRREPRWGCDNRGCKSVDSSGTTRRYKSPGGLGLRSVVDWRRHGDRLGADTPARCDIAAAISSQGCGSGMSARVDQPCPPPGASVMCIGERGALQPQSSMPASSRARLEQPTVAAAVETGATQAHRRAVRRAWSVLVRRPLMPGVFGSVIDQLIEPCVDDPARDFSRCLRDPRGSSRWAVSTTFMRRALLMHLAVARCIAMPSR